MIKTSSKIDKILEEFEEKYTYQILGSWKEDMIDFLRSHLLQLQIDIEGCVPEEKNTCVCKIDECLSQCAGYHNSCREKTLENIKTLFDK